MGVSLYFSYKESSFIQYHVRSINKTIVASLCCVRTTGTRVHGSFIRSINSQHPVRTLTMDWSLDIERPVENLS